MADAPDADRQSHTWHGTAIAIGDYAALIVGPSGSGKSDLALRCLALAPTPLIPVGASLVADDRVTIARDNDRLRIGAPAAICGRMEVRGSGILAVPHVPGANLALIAELVASKDVDRLPDPAPYREILGLNVPLLRLAPFEASAPVKLLLALAREARMRSQPQE